MPMTDLTRRNFVIASAGVLGAVAVSRGQTTKPASSPSGLLDAGPLKELKAGFNDGLLKTNKIVIVVADGKAFAESAVCTHKGCALKMPTSEDGPLRCPCHGSKFDVQGFATSGPAKGQLSRYGVQEKDGHLWVDPDKIILPGDFEKEGAFVEMPK